MSPFSSWCPGRDRGRGFRYSSIQRRPIRADSRGSDWSRAPSTKQSILRGNPRGLDQYTRGNRRLGPGADPCTDVQALEAPSARVQMHWTMPLHATPTKMQRARTDLDKYWQMASTIWEIAWSGGWKSTSSIVLFFFGWVRPCLQLSSFPHQGLERFWSRLAMRS
ncbi:hypothetical protein VUR80DRAFT_567 [Thermomyces stellatus]